jgi:hypothetical protein
MVHYLRSMMRLLEKHEDQKTAIADIGVPHGQLCIMRWSSKQTRTPHVTRAQV